MNANNGPRFHSVGAAARFYLRVRALFLDDLAPGKRRRIVTRNRGYPNLLDDFLLLDSCFRRLDSLQARVIGELYGPSGFGASRGRVSDSSDDAPPGCGKRGTSRLRADALAALERHLGRHRLV